MSKITSTYQLHYNPNKKEYAGQFTKYREQMDYDFFTNYTIERQEVQDEIMAKFANKSPNLIRSPQLIFTCGCFGAGKSHSIKYLNSMGLINVKDYIYIDPDNIKRQLPEWGEYIIKDPNNVGSLLHTESMYISLLLQYICLDRGYQIIVDGSMRDYSWYLKHFAWVNQIYPHYKIGIFYIRASLSNILRRCEKRGLLTGRIIAPNMIREIYPTTQISFDKLKPCADFHMIIENNEMTEIIEFGNHPVPRMKEN